MERKDFLNPEHMPKMIGPYKVEAPFARGGMSYVFLGYDPESTEKKNVILKVIDPEYANDKSRNDAFMNEARILGQVYHPNIPKIYSVGKWEHGIYIAMEFFKGISLRAFVVNMSFSLKKSLEIILKIAHALYYLHSQGIVHRDLKPENVLITEDGEIKVIDFSISQLIPEGELEHIIQNPQRAGTAMYMAPEQLDNPKLVTKATDIYALGIIAFELILGRSTHGIIQTFLLPMGLRQIIEKALQINPALRYDDVFEFIQEITKYKKKLEEGKEEREVATSGPVNDLLNHIHSILLPKKGPKWPSLEIGIATQAGMAINGLYLDFFPLKESQYALFMAEPLRTGVNSLFHVFGLRGMVRLETLGKESITKETFQRFSKTLYNDPIDQKFGACSLVLEPKNNKAIFSNCKFAQLWQIREDIRVIETKGNPVLGHFSKTAFQEVSFDWEKGDLLILYSQIMDIKQRQGTIPVIFAVKDMEIEQLATKLLKDLLTLSPTATHQGSCLVAIRKKN